MVFLPNKAQGLFQVRLLVLFQLPH